MKNIKKLGKAVATSALLVGATLTGAAAQTSGSSGAHNLGDYPQPFVDENGNVDTAIVVGNNAKTQDVVGAIDIAGSLSQAAYTTETKQVSVGSGPGGTWSATNGLTLDTRNDQVFFGDNIQTVRQTLTEDHLNILQTDGQVLTGNQEQEMEQYLYVGNQDVKYGTHGESNIDPELYVNNPENPTTGKNTNNNLYQLQANFQEGVDFKNTNGDTNRNDDVTGQEITMFGQQFTIGDDSFYGDNAGQLVLYGSQQTTSIQTGSSTTLTINGQEHTFALEGVTNENEAVLTIDGTQHKLEEDESITVDGKDVRVTTINNFGENSGSAVDSIQIGVGSEKVILEDQEQVMLGDDEEEVDGTYVDLAGNLVGGDISSSGPADDVQLSSISIAVGASDSDSNYVAAGETFTDPVFENLKFRFGGLNPDASSAEGEDVGRVDYSTSGDDTATVSLTGQGGNSGTVDWFYDSNTGTTGTGEMLADSDGNHFVVTEGATVQNDQYLTTDAGDFSHLWEVTNIDRDETGTTIASDDEATIELTDAVSGQSVEVDLDATDDTDNNGFGDTGDYYAGTEVIDGQTYKFVLEGGSNSEQELEDDGNADFAVAWGTGSDVSSGDGANVDIGNNLNIGSVTSLYSAVDSESGAAVGFTHQTTAATGIGVNSTDLTLELPSTESTDAEQVTMSFSDNDGTVNGERGLDVDVNGDGTDDITNIDDSENTSSGSATFTAGQTDYLVNVTDTNGGKDSISAQIQVSVDSDQTASKGVAMGPATVNVLPEDDNDEEHAYIVEPGNDGSSADSEVEINGDDNAGTVYYTGSAVSSPELTVGNSGKASVTQRQLDSDDDVYTSYDFFGTYTRADTSGQGSFTMHVPAGQSTVGAAFTTAAGSLSGQGGASGSVTTQSPAGWPDVGMLDSQVQSSTRSGKNLILVGGPVVNTLVQDLVDAGKTMAASEYTSGQSIIQQIDDAFSSGNDALVVAGQSAADTQYASNYLANYQDHQDALAGKDKVTLMTGQGVSTS